MEKTIKSRITLNDGVEIPYLGLGTWLSRGRECRQAVKYALEYGYDHIDTAQAYDNENEVGDGWKDSGRSRDELFITTKIRNSNQGFERSKQSLTRSLQALQTEYVDLLLIHWPDVNNFERTIQTWRALIKLREEGLCRSIGVSNFTIRLLDKLLEEIDVVPAVNQVEFHTYLFQKELLEYCQGKRIQIEAYSPIARAKFLDNDQIQRIAKKYHKTPAQVMLAWCVNHDLVVIPKTVHKDRIEENADIFFELDDDDMKALNKLGPETRLVQISEAPPSW